MNQPTLPCSAHTADNVSTSKVDILEEDNFLRKQIEQTEATVGLLAKEVKALTVKQEMLEKSISKQYEEKIKYLLEENDKRVDILRNEIIVLELLVKSTQEKTTVQILEFKEKTQVITEFEKKQETMFSLLKKNDQKFEKTSSSLQKVDKERLKAEDEIRKIRSSATYKIGRFFTYIPRLIRKILT